LPLPFARDIQKQMEVCHASSKKLHESISSASLAKPTVARVEAWAVELPWQRKTLDAVFGATGKRSL
jgi:polysaccharide deacetylase 2 family uncharacterized protein YibQ